MEPSTARTREWIIQEILKIRRSGVFPSMDYVDRIQPALLNAALDEYKAWEWALVAAKVIVPPVDPDMFYDHRMCAWAHDSLTVPINR
jgi:hypothetical protein